MTAATIGGERPRRAKVFAENAEINVVPFVDIMLVLLIIFMVAAPLATVNVQVDLPPPSTQPPPSAPPKDPIFISLQQTGQIYLGDTAVPFESLGAAVFAAAKGDHDNRIMVRADQQVLYGQVMHVMNVLQNNGFNKVALVSEEVV